MKIRSFFSVLLLIAISAFAVQANAQNISVGVGGVGTTNGNPFVWTIGINNNSQQQQIQHRPQQQACPAGQQLWNMSDRSQKCLPINGQQVQQQPQYQPQQQVVINNNNYQQPPQYQQQGGQAGSPSCPCVVTQWGKACGNAAQSHEYNNPHMRLQCTR